MICTLIFCIFETWELSKDRGEGKVDDCEMELVMMRRGSFEEERFQKLDQQVVREHVDSKSCFQTLIQGIGVSFQDFWTLSKLNRTGQPFKLTPLNT